MMPTFETALLAECIADSGGVLSLVQVLSPDSLEVHDILGNVYVCMIYKQGEVQERDVP